MAGLYSVSGGYNVTVIGGAGDGPAANLVSRSGTITLGGSAQTIAAANSARLGFLIIDLGSGGLWMNPLGVAAGVQPSLLLPTYWTMPAVFYGAISLYAADTGHAFTALEW